MKQDMSNFDSDSLTCEPTLFLAKKISNSSKSTVIVLFPEKGEEIDY